MVMSNREPAIHGQSGRTKDGLVQISLATNSHGRRANRDRNRKRGNHVRHGPNSASPARSVTTHGPMRRRARIKNPHVTSPSTQAPNRHARQSPRITIRPPTSVLALPTACRHS